MEYSPELAAGSKYSPIENGQDVLIFLITFAVIIIALYVLVKVRRGKQEGSHGSRHCASGGSGLHGVSLDKLQRCPGSNHRGCSPFDRQQPGLAGGGRRRT